MSEIANVLSSYAKKNVDEIRDKWNGSGVDGVAEINFAVASDTPAEITGEYKATGRKMWALEHGTGSLMDDERENPGLSAYKRSPDWNKEREHNEIRTRSREEGYYDLSGKWHHGSDVGMPHGINKEEAYGKLRVEPMAPRHIIGEALGLVNGKRIQTAREEMMKADILSAFGKTFRREVRRVVK